MWLEKPLSELAEITSGGTPSRDRPELWGGDIPWVTPTDISACGINLLTDTKEKISVKGLLGSAAKIVPAGSVLLTSRATIGEARIAAMPVCTNQGFKNLTAKQAVDARFLFYQVQRCRGMFERYAAGSTFPEINKRDTGRVGILHPQSVSQQRRIAAILTSLDTAIEKTEALIEKHQQIKAGLMHDLFTRGVLPDGQLRPRHEQKPDTYRVTPIGCIPEGWAVKEINSVVASIVDGPFGSNLKSEHYVVDAGVRVVRLQNVTETAYDDGDKAYISTRHASALVRNKVVAGDVLIAGLGDERYAVGRACCYPPHLEPAVNKADCFRARCNPDVMRNSFLMLFLNSELARHQMRRFEQGVTRPRVNTGNMKRLHVCVPSLAEQDRIIEQFEAVSSAIANQEECVEKLRNQKLGLMQDLLTGKVPVKVEAPAPEPVDA